MLRFTRTMLAALPLVAVLAPAPAFAQKPKVAVLDLTANEPVKRQEAEQLTDVVRNVAVSKMPGFDVITKENLVVLLKANNRTLAECEGECEVETGRLIGADIVVSGTVGMLGTTYLVTLKVHSTTEGRMLDGQNGKASKMDDLISVIEDTAARLFVKVPGSGAGGGPTPMVPVGPLGGPQTDAAFRASSKVAIRITTEPQGAALAIDNRDVPQATPYGDFIEPGSYTLRISLQKYITKEEQIRVERPKDGGQLSFHFVLEPNFGHLHVSTSPGNATVLLDGQTRGSTPLDVREVSPGVHTVKIEKPGFYEFEQAIEVKRGETAEIKHDLQKMLGGLQLMAVGPDQNAVEGTLYVDGTKLGSVPYVGELQVGSRTIRVESGAGVWEGVIDIPHHQTVERRVEVKKEAPRRVSTPSIPSRIDRVLRYGRRIAIPQVVGLPLLGPLQAVDRFNWHGGAGFGNDAFRFRPKVFLDGGYDTNVYQGSDKATKTGAGAIRATPGFDLEYATKKFLLRLDGLADINYYAGGENKAIATGDSAVQYGSQVGLVVDYAPADFVSLRAYNFFNRSLTPRDFTFENRYMRNSNRTGAMLVLEPDDDDDAVADDVGIRMGYAYLINRYDDVDNWDLAAHEFDWYLGIPTGKTFAWILDGKYAKINYAKTDTGLIDGHRLFSTENFNIGSEPLLVYGGVAWALAKEVRLLAKVGYGWTFTNKTGSSASEILWAAEVRMRFKSAFGAWLGYSRHLDDAYYADYILTDHVYLRTRFILTNAMNVDLTGAYDRPRYGKFAFAGTMADRAGTFTPSRNSRHDHAASLRAEWSYNILPFLGANLGYELSGRWSDTELRSDSDDKVSFDYVRHFVYAGVFSRF